MMESSACEEQAVEECPLLEQEVRAAESKTDEKHVAGDDIHLNAIMARIIMQSYYIYTILQGLARG